MYLVLFEFCFDAKNPGYDVYCHDQEADEEPSNLNHSLSLSRSLLDVEEGGRKGSLFVRG